MSAETIGDRIEQNRAFAPFEDRLLAAEGINDGERIVSVNPFGVHLFRVHTGADASDELHAHGFAEGLASHAVKVVHAIEDDRQSPAERRIPKIAILIHRRERDSLPNRTAGEGGISNVRHHNTALAIHPLIESRARRNRTGAANNRIVGVNSKGREEGVHRAAQAAVESGFPREHFAVGAIENEAGGQALYRTLIYRRLIRRTLIRRIPVSLLDRTKHRAIAVSSHNCHELLVTQLPDCRECFRQDLAVTAMRSENVIIGSQRECHAYGCRFLPNRKVRGTGVIVSDPLVGAGGLELLQNGFKFADRTHLPPDLQELFARVHRQFFPDGLVICVHRNIGEVNCSRRKCFFWFDHY